MRRTLLVVLLISLSLVSTVALAQSQATTGVIEGTVTDASGAALPGVTVIMKNMMSWKTRSRSGTRFGSALASSLMTWLMA